MKKAKRDKSQKLNIKKARKSLSSFSSNLIIDLYLDGGYDSISSDEILDRFIEDEFGVTKSKNMLIALFDDKMGGVIRDAIKKARGEGVPCVPVNYSYFELSQDELNDIETEDKAQPFVAGKGTGNGAFGCRFITETDDYDPFFANWHRHIAQTTNGLIDASKELTEAGNKQKLVGYGSNSKLVRSTRSAVALPVPE